MWCSSHQAWLRLKPHPTARWAAAETTKLFSTTPLNLYDFANLFTHELEPISSVLSTLLRHSAMQHSLHSLLWQEHIQALLKTLYHRFSGHYPPTGNFTNTKASPGPHVNTSLADTISTKLRKIQFTSLLTAYTRPSLLENFRTLFFHFWPRAFDFPYGCRCRHLHSDQLNSSFLTPHR